MPPLCQASCAAGLEEPTSSYSGIWSNILKQDTQRAVKPKGQVCIQALETHPKVSVWPLRGSGQGLGSRATSRVTLALCLSLEGGIGIPTSEDLSGLICCTLVAFRPQSLDTRRLGPSPVPLMASTSPPPHTTPHLSGASQNRDSTEMVHRLASVREQRSFLQHTTLPRGHLALLLPAPWAQI